MVLNFHTHSFDKEENIIKFYNTDLRKGEKEFLKGDYICCGIHPWWINDFTPLNKKKIRKILLNKKILCLGEIGLDRVFKKNSFEQQQEYFDFQLEIAVEREDKFIIIHCVKAYQDILNSVKKSGFSGKLVFHDYNANEEMTKKLIDRGDYFSYGAMLFKNESRAMKSLKIIPLDKLFIETDGHTDFTIEEAYHRASLFFNIPTEDLINNCLSNFNALLE